MVIAEAVATEDAIVAQKEKEGEALERERERERDKRVVTEEKLKGELKQTICRKREFWGVRLSCERGR